MREIIEKTTDAQLRAQMERVASFHGYLSTGAFIGVQMINIARRILEIKDGERLFVTCETHNCLPDPFQILTGCTIGNKGLKILDHGKMAVTVSRRAVQGDRARAVRIMLDPAKTNRYPRLHAWFMKTEKIPHPEAVSLLLQAGEDVYTWKLLELEVPPQPSKVIALCELCQESCIQRAEEKICPACREPPAAEQSFARMKSHPERDIRCLQS
ncbi:MAG: formylmethanofuran dehydrogenase [Methanosarcinales archaeon]|nr:formylmethanofuran dehydrogenase [Methanosarcinales archaeon]